MFNIIIWYHSQLHKSIQKKLLVKSCIVSTVYLPFTVCMEKVADTNWSIDPSFYLIGYKLSVLGVCSVLLKIVCSSISVHWQGDPFVFFRLTWHHQVQWHDYFVAVFIHFFQLRIKLLRFILSHSTAQWSRYRSQYSSWLTLCLAIKNKSSHWIVTSSSHTVHPTIPPIHRQSAVGWSRAHMISLISMYSEVSADFSVFFLTIIT